jgi:hypothetical protein
MEGLNAIDQGGPYREMLDRITQELHGPSLVSSLSLFLTFYPLLTYLSFFPQPLFMPCPNQKTNAGDNRDSFVPRPLSAVDKSLRLSAYEVVGQLMGLAIRTQNLLPFRLPSIVWKGLLKDEATEDDIRAHDLLSFRIVNDIQAALEKGNKEVFDSGMQSIKFTVSGADQKVSFCCSLLLFLPALLYRPFLAFRFTN